LEHKQMVLQELTADMRLHTTTASQRHRLSNAARAQRLRMCRLCRCMQV
jgi:hypothetical protein